MSGLTIPCVSPHQIFHDLEDCITSSPSKVLKRLNRLRVLCIVMGIDFDIYISHLKVCEEKMPKPEIDEVIAFINRPLPSNEIKRIIFDANPTDDTVKKMLEATTYF